MKPMHLLTRLTSLAVSLFIAGNAVAHGRWLVPSHLMLSGERPHTINVDMSISNELFKPDHGFLASKPDPKKGPPISRLHMLEPDGEKIAELPFTYLKRKSVAAIPLDKSGTHHIYLAQAPVHFINFTKADGKPSRAWGTTEQAKLPAGASNTKAYRMLSTINSYVSRNTLTEPKLIGKGMELTGSHPNDLFVGETSRFQLLFNGEPFNQVHELVIVREGTRYRNDREVLTVKTDKQGTFDVTWLKPGMYLVETELNVASEDASVDIIKYALYTTLEINAE